MKRKMILGFVALSMVMALCVGCGNKTPDLETESENFGAVETESEAMADETVESTETESEDTENEEEIPAYEIIDGSNLSKQSYDYAFQVGTNSYLVQNGDAYGLVDYEGNEIVPISYSDYTIVGTNEIEFPDGDKRYIYNTESNILVYEYVKYETVERKELEVIQADDGQTITVIRGREVEEEYDSPVSCNRSYQGGLLCETVEVVASWERDPENPDLFGSSNHRKITYTNINTGKVVYSGYTGSWVWGTELVAYDERYMFSCNGTDGDAVVVEYSLQDGELYLVTIGTDSYTRNKIDDISYYKGNMRYDKDWLLMPYTESLINTRTMQRLTVPYKTEEVSRWYYGSGEYYGLGIGTEDDVKYSMCKGDKVLVDDCISLGFISDTFKVYSKQSGEHVFIDNDGKEIMKVEDYSGFINGKAFIYDGTGIYYVDEGLNKVSDYIYKGTVNGCGRGVVLLGERYYLLRQN